MAIDPATPVLIGVGQSVERIETPGYQASCPAELAARAARAALEDCGLGPDAATRIEAIATTRTFEDMYPQPAPFGRSSNFPRSVSSRLGCDPQLAVWEKGGGNTPQDLVSEFGQRIADGEFGLVLLAGAEAISTIAHARKNGITLDFAEDPPGNVEDRGSGLEEYYDPLARRHGLLAPTLCYALCENARRSHMGADGAPISRAAYAAEMGALFAPFTDIAAANPFAAWQAPAQSAQELASPSPANRWIADPYTLHLVARDKVNMGAAVLLASHGMADRLGIPHSLRTYLHAHASATEKALLRRPDLGSSPAAKAVTRRAMAMAHADVEAIAGFDFYSCFPIAVSNVALDALGLAADDPRGLTLTGGLPFFGGPGNNYSMHAIAEAVQRARTADGRPVLVAANGGYLSKYSVGLYSAEPRPWQAGRDAELKAELDRVPDVEPLESFAGSGIVETYTVSHGRDGPSQAIVVGTNADGRRFIACTGPDGRGLAARMHERDCLGREVTVEQREEVNLITAI